MIVSLSHVPCGYLQASGRPDIPARFHVLELLVHLPLTWAFVHTWGITGAALAWTARVALDAALLFLASDRVLGMSVAHAFQLRGGRVLSSLLLLSAMTLLARGTRLHILLTGGLMMLVFGTFALFVWRIVLNANERSSIRHAVSLRRRQSQRSAEQVIAH